MFTALYYGEKIDISDYSAPKMALSKDGLRCLFCNAPLFIKAGLIRAAHFSHYPENTCQFETLQGEPETPKHRALKDFIWKRGFIDCPLVIIWVDTEILDIKTSPSLRVVIIGNPTWIKRHCVHSIRQSFKERVVLRSFLK